MARAISSQAGVFLVTHTSRKARNAAVNCSIIEMIRMNIIGMVDLLY